jgi:NitT/TauT family transport system substrate-binding protein
MKLTALLKQARFVPAAMAAVALLAAPLGAAAQEKIRIAGSQKGFWDATLFAYADQVQGTFKKEGIDLEILWTSGGSDCENPVITGSLDMCLATGILGAITAWGKGAPIAIIAGEMTGSPDVWWYAKADSGIKSMKDTNGKTVAFSRPGSSSQLLALALVKAAGTNAKVISTGGGAATMTQVMSGQIDVGWSAGVLGYDMIKQGKIVRVAGGNEAPGVASQTVRVHVVNTNFLKAKPALVKRFLAAYQKSIDVAYTDPAILEVWAKESKIDLDTARTVREQMFPKASLAMRPIGNIELSIQQALDDKRLAKPLTPAQVKDLLRYVDELAK